MEESAREKLKGGQRSGSGSAGPKLDVSMWLAAAGDTKGVPSFTWYDRVKKEKKFSKKAITGIFLGSAMRISAFSTELGSNGGEYTSSVYFNREMPISVWYRSAKGQTKLCEGNLEFVEEALAKAASDKPSKRQILFILTDKGVVAVETNLSIAIDQLHAATGEDENIFIENYIELTPTLYDPEDKSISDKAKKYLGPFAPTNPPKYASISINGDLDDATIDTALSVIEQYQEWKEHRIGAVAETTEEAQEEAPVQAKAPVASAMPPPAQPAEPPEATEEDDLPF